MRLLLIAATAVLLSACADDPGSTGWCEAKKAQEKSQWTGEDAKTFAKHCLLESQTIGSEKWCANLEDKDKADWTTSEAADYAKNCVIK